MIEVDGWNNVIFIPGAINILSMNYMNRSTNYTNFNNGHELKLMLIIYRINISNLCLISNKKIRPRCLCSTILKNLKISEIRINSWTKIIGFI